VKPKEKNIMAAICNVCGLPDELCICQEIAKEQQRAIISTDRRRYGKIVTKVEGIEDSAIDINQLAKLLKNKCAAGGTVKGRTRKHQAYSKITDSMWRCADMEIYNNTWIGTTLNVVGSSDPTLVGRSGIVLNETKNTLVLLDGDAHVTLGKAAITFTIDNSDVVIQGAFVGQRPEDRTHRKYRKA
jgi:translation initiation factor 1